MLPEVRVLFLAAEAAPYVKIGGLADVAGSLPRALKRLSVAEPKVRVDIQLVLPLHRSIDLSNYEIKSRRTFKINHSKGPIQTESLSTEVDGLTIHFIEGYPIRNTREVYNSPNEIDGEKYTFFSLAALELIKKLDWTPNILHANDWHTAPALYAISLFREMDTFYRNISTMLTIHNLPYLGVGTSTALENFGLPPASASPLPNWAQHLPLPLGIFSADKVTTVSPGYASEMKTKKYGAGLDEFLISQEIEIIGILNGIDESLWDPEIDPFIVRKFTKDSIDTRIINKRKLLDEIGLIVDPAIPLISMISRLDHQKGVDLVPTALNQLDDIPWQFVILGTGDESIEQSVRLFESEYPDRVRAIFRYDPKLARKIYASADVILIPSRYEPCGLTQMIAMHYGCVPVARATGGLQDTIFDYHENEFSTGFKYNDPSPEELSNTIKRALSIWKNKKEWEAMQKRCMSQDFSWDKSAQQYLSLYHSMIDISRR